MTSPSVYLEAADEVVSRQQLVEDELKRVVPAGLVQSEHVERPPVDVLRDMRMLKAVCVCRLVQVVAPHLDVCNTFSTDMTEGG